MKDIHRIVITGGPCAGKTTAFARIESELSVLGYKVFVVPETFSEMYGGGIKLSEYPNVEFQDMLLRTQLSKEAIYDEAAEKCKEEKVIILFDRGAVDGLAYTGIEDIAEIFKRNNLSLGALMSRYDAVIHMVTAADGAEKIYLENKASNAARYETVKEAIETDNILKTVWTGHPRLRIIDNSTDFETKINRVINEILCVVGYPLPLEIERKFLIETPDLDKLVNLFHARKCEIVQTYLNYYHEPEEVEKRIRMQTIEGTSTYFYTEKKPLRTGVRIEIEKKISKREYLALLFTNPELCEIKQLTKTRYRFVYNNMYFELDLYHTNDPFSILEIELSSEAEATAEIQLPEFFTCIKEVTGNPEFSNAHLATQHSSYVEEYYDEWED